MPDDSPLWYPDFCSEIFAFNGVNDKHDDQVDALAAAVNKLTIPKSPRGMGTSPIGAF